MYMYMYNVVTQPCMKAYVHAVSYAAVKAYMYVRDVVDSLKVNRLCEGL